MQTRCTLTIGHEQMHGGDHQNPTVGIQVGIVGMDSYIECDWGRMLHAHMFSARPMLRRDITLNIP